MRQFDRTDAKIRSGQNFRKAPIRKTSNNRYEKFPRVGEVIQERFNPRPYFDYIPDSPKVKNADIEYSNDKPLEIVTSNPPLRVNSDQLMNTYGSPYTSYNPAPDDAGTKEKDKDMQNFRPTVNYDDIMEYNTPPTLYDNQEEEDDKQKDKTPVHEDNGDDDDFTKYHYQNDEIGQPIVQTMKPPPPIKEYNNYEHETGHSIKDFEDDHHSNEDMDLSPPPPDNYQKFPAVYANHEHFIDYDHHHEVYHEVKTTTTPAPKEHERVNQAHYSYYYLGRKLYYIPLYFSVYFIVYVTILILKSIARHKVQFVQHFENRNSRNIDTSRIENDVNTAIYNSSQKYMM